MFVSSQTKNIDLRNLGKVVYSVSIKPDLKAGHDLRGGLRWALENASEVAIYFGDGSLLRTTLAVLGYQGHALEEHYSAIVSRTLKNLAETISSFEVERKQSANVVYRPASTLHDWPVFSAALTEVKVHYQREGAFARSVQADAAAYLERLARRGELKMNEDEANFLGIEYLLFEIAGYLCLARQGALIDVYAGGSGELPTLERFMNGSLAGLEPLSQRNCLILKSR